MTPDLPESVKITLAGAAFEITRGAASGSFFAIPLPLWSAILGFHREISLRHQAESMSYHRWHAREGRYHSFIPHQSTAGRGLSVNCNLQSAENTALLDSYGRAYQEDFMQGACTIHTHVDIGAFESGTDANDEKSLPAWHITLGRLISRQEYDLDFRMRLPHTPKIRALLSPDQAYKMDWACLFAEGVKRDEVFKCPGSSAWIKYCSRVSVR